MAVDKKDPLVENAEQAISVVSDALVDCGVDFEQVDGSQFIVSIPGLKRLKTACLLSVFDDSLRIEAFISRHPDEDFGRVYDYLLRRSRKMYVLSYTLDNHGDIYLVGRIPLRALTVGEVDRILGAVSEASDRDFNVILELGFHTSIRKEWAWRVKRGESLMNLKAFEHLIGDAAARDAEAEEL